MTVLSNLSYIARLQLTNFRSYQQVDFTCTPAIQVLLGQNGAGKTNILEAISMFGTGRGLRSAAFADLICYHCETASWTVFSEIMDQDQQSLQIGIRYCEGNRSFHLNGAPATGFRQLDEILPQLWLTPAMDRLFTDTASARRRFFDRFAQTLTPALSGHNQKFERAMRERNKILQTELSRENHIWLDGIEETMAVQAVGIAAARLQAIDHLAYGLAQQQSVTSEHDFPLAQIALDGELEAALKEHSLLDVEDMYRDMLARNRVVDAQAGRTLNGPHRSDFLVSHLIKKMPAALCSTGEQKGLLVGLILAQARCVQDQTGSAPLLLLDEVAAHLDARHRASLLAHLQALGGQVWITGTDSNPFCAFQDSAQFYTICDGVIKAIRD